MTYGNDIKMTIPTNFKISRNSIIKKNGMVTVRIENSIQSLIKYID